MGYLMKGHPFHDGEIVIKASDLSVSRGNTIVLDDINLTIRQGDFVGLVGPNGSGKTTLLMAILGLLNPTSGSVEIFGQDSKRMNHNGRVAWVSQAASNLPKNIRITVRELISLGVLTAKTMLPFFKNRKDVRAKVEDALELVGLRDVADVDIYSLSGGQRQRAVIGRALVSNAEILVFDEPLVGVDRDSRNSLLKLLDDLCHTQNKTLLMVSHDLAAIRQSAHRVIYLDLIQLNDCCRGGIQYDGPPSEFPDLLSLATLRGIRNVHSPEPIIISHKEGISKPKVEEE
jgi:zinc transport system ATP-binding protein